MANVSPGPSPPTVPAGRPFRIWSATPTPLDAKGGLDEGSVGRLVDQHLALGVGGLFLAGSCGEGRYLSSDVRKRLVSGVRKAAGSSLVLSVQVADRLPANLRDDASRMRDAGADLLLLALPPDHEFRNGEQVRRYFSDSLDGLGMDAGLYALPLPGVTDPAAMWGDLAAHPRVVCIKDSTRSVEVMESFIVTRRLRADLLLFSGDEFDVARYAAAGYDGAMLGTGILVAGMIRRALDAHRLGRKSEAKRWQDRSNAVVHDLFREDLSGWVSGLKYALVALGVFDNGYARIGDPVNQQDRERIDVMLEREREWLRPPAGSLSKLAIQ